MFFRRMQGCFFISNVRFIVIVIVKRTCHVLNKYARIQISIPLYVEDKQEDIMSATYLGCFFSFASFLRIFPLPDGLRSLCSRVGTLVLDAGEVLAIHWSLMVMCTLDLLRETVNLLQRFNCFEFESTTQTPQKLVNRIGIPNWWFRSYNGSAVVR